MTRVVIGGRGWVGRGCWSVVGELPWRLLRGHARHPLRCNVPIVQADDVPARFLAHSGWNDTVPYCPLIAPYLGMLCFRNFCDLKNEGWVIFNLGIPPVFSITTRTSTWIASTKLVLFSRPYRTPLARFRGSRGNPATVRRFSKADIYF